MPLHIETPIETTVEINPVAHILQSVGPARVTYKGEVKVAGRVVFEYYTRTAWDVGYRESDAISEVLDAYTEALRLALNRPTT